MRKTIKGGSVDTHLYLAEGGYVALQQPAQPAGNDQVVLLSAEQLPELIRELQALYDDRKTWEEAAVE
jgi:hypothetical protein